jgi:HK97 family phage portal protein
MNFPRWLTPWRKATDQNAVTPIRPVYSQPSKFGWIVEAFGGMWQANLRIDNTQTLLTFSAVYACLSLISGDIAKLGVKLKKRAESGIWEESQSSAFSPLLRKPNRYQTWLQFIEQWILSKLIFGNTYVLKERDNRRVVVALYILDAASVTPLVANDGEVFYQINENKLAGIAEGSPIFPASEIMHDRAKCLFHPLVGVAPLHACAASVTQGNRIQSNSSVFFGNMSRPSGQLTAPGRISPETAKRLKEEFEQGFSGSNLGRLFVSGDGLKFEPFTIPAEQAQLIEQLKFTVEDVARSFGVPLYKVQAGQNPTFNNVGALNLEYYQQSLQPHIESIELLLDDGLSLPADLMVEFNLETLLRMDPKTRFETLEIGVRAGVLSPNESRACESLPPVAGGDTPYLQQQNYSLAALAKRDAQADPFGSAAPPAPAAPKPEDDEDDDAKRLCDALMTRLKAATPEVQP